MHITTYTEARQKLKSLMDKVCDDADIAIITRKNGEDIVMMPRSEYDGLQETLHLLSSPKNAERLLESIKDTEAAMTFESPEDFRRAFDL